MSNEILSKCPGCRGLPLIPAIVPGGDGENPIPQVCAVCGGTKTISFGELLGLDNAIDKLNDIMDKCNDIFEKVNE